MTVTTLQQHTSICFLSFISFLLFHLCSDFYQLYTYLCFSVIIPVFLRYNKMKIPFLMLKNLVVDVGPCFRLRPEEEDLDRRYVATEVLVQVGQQYR